MNQLPLLSDYGGVGSRNSMRVDEERKSWEPSCYKNGGTYRTSGEGGEEPG